MTRQIQAEKEQFAGSSHTIAMQASDRLSRWKASTEKLQREALTVWFIIKARRAPWHLRIIAGCVAAYVFSPVQLIPSFIPVIGLLDDVLVLAIGLRLIRATSPKPVLERAQRRAEISLRRGENIRPVAARLTTAFVALFWLVSSVCLILVLR
jgi:uncharacterized membrane protein YkvA (DUF1232 family)